MRRSDRARKFFTGAGLKLIKQLYLIVLFLPSLPVFGDDTGLLRTDRENLAPMETINITVHDVNSSCTLSVLTPTGHLQNFTGTISDSNCHAVYIPSYLVGTYEVSAVADGNTTETDTFTVASDDWGGEISLITWDSSTAEYLPGEQIVLTAEIVDGNLSPLTSFSKTFGDNLPNYNRGALYIQRKIIGIDGSGNLVARVYVYFDTTGAPNIFGNNYAHIYAGTQVDISLYAGDGQSPIDPAITIFEGFENNGDNALDSNFVDTEWTVTVNSTIFQQEKTAYLDFVIPQSKSLSDISFSADYIKYNHNNGIGDRIYIGNAYVAENTFPAGYEFTTGYSFAGLGRFPIHLPLNPSPDGLIYYHLSYDTLPGHTLNEGTVEVGGSAYTNTWTWKRVADEACEITFYADKWGYSHAYGSPIPVILESASRDNIHILNYSLDKRVYTEGETRQLTAELKDEYANPVSGFKMNESVTNSENGKLSILSRNVGTDPNGSNVVRLLLYFDTTGRWSDIFAGTTVDISIFGSDGKTGVDPNIVLDEGFVDANGFIATALSENTGIYSWTATVTTNFTGADRQVYLDFIIPSEHSASEVVYAVNRIYYKPRLDWADYMTIKTTTLSMSQFPLSGNWGAYEFNTGDRFGTLGYFPLYVSLNPHNSSIFPKMRSDSQTSLSGTLAESAGNYTYSHTWTGDAGPDYQTAMCISKYGYFDNKNRCTEDIMLYFSGEPRYLGGLEDEPVRLGTTWEKNLHDHFFIELDYNNVEYSTFAPSVSITDNIATFSPFDTNDTIYDLVITAQSVNDPCLIAHSAPFILYAAECFEPYECGDFNLPRQCVNYQCEYYDSANPFREYPQGVDLSIFNEDVNISNQFPDQGEQVRICADVYNKGTAYVYDVNVCFYLDDINSVPIGVNTLPVIPITYFDLPFRYETACIDWNVPAEISGAHRIWVKVKGNYPTGMEESMLSNNYATLDFFVNDPDMNALDPGIVGSCPYGASALATGPAHMLLGPPQQECITAYMRIPFQVQVCENETVCGPVTGYEYSYWSTWYWPSWSGYCKEFSPGGDALWAFIITYEVAYGIFNAGASARPSLIDGYNLLKTPYGWGTGWLPSHPAPTLFPYNDYGGIDNPGDGGLCPVSAWDCGEGVSFEPRFDSPYYHAYAFSTFGPGARRMTRCHTETDYMEIPYQICYPIDGSDPPIRMPFNPFDGSPDPNDSGFGPTGAAPPGYGPNGGPPISFTLGPPMTPDGNSAGFECYFCSTGTATSNSSSDYIQCVPVLPYNEVRLRRGWNLWTLTMAPVDAEQDPAIPLYEGWNTFGYSSPDPFSWASTMISKGGETKTLEQAEQAGWLQATIYYFDNETNLIRFVPGDDDSLRTNKAYWLYAKQNNLNLILPGAGGSLVSNSLLWSDLNAVYGLETKSLTDAQDAGWLDAAIYYHDANDGMYKSLPADGEYIYSWNGYWIYSSLDGVKLQAPDPNGTVGLFDSKGKAFAEEADERRAQKAKQPRLSKCQMQALADLSPGLTPKLGQSAPDFLLPDMAGNLIRLNDRNSSDVLLVFGSTSCPYCADKVPLLNTIESGSKDRGIKVIFVALGADRNTAKDYVSQMDISFEVLADAYGDAAQRYGIKKVPEAFLIDKDGIIQYSSQEDGQTIWQFLEVRSSSPYSSMLGQENRS